MNYGFFKKIFAFSDYERDRWVAQRAAEIKKNSKILDVGAGPCRYRKLFSDCEYRAHDFAKLSKELTGLGGYGKLDYISDILDIPVKDKSFDVILCTEVIEHVPEPIAVLGEISRILKPGGLLLMTAPLRSGLHQKPYHFYGGFTPFWYSHFLPKYGLKIVSIEANGGFFRSYGEESQRFVSILFPKKGRGRSRRIVFFPVFVILKFLALFLCVICFLLDELDSEKEFTIGYHLKAKKVK